MYTWIDEIVLGLQESYDTSDVYELYNFLGINIKELEPNNILLRGNDSLYARDYLDTETVYIRDDLTSELKKFILLHELGHALLHVDILSAAFNRNLLNKHKMERQANYFAFAMLNLEIDGIEMEGMTLQQIASYIKVPYEPLSHLIDL